MEANLNRLKLIFTKMADDGFDIIKPLKIDNGKLTSKYFIVQNSNQLEYSSGNLYSESLISWNTCHNYSLAIKKIYYNEKGLQVGDTLFVNIQSVKNDTLHCIASAYDQSVMITLLKSKITQ